MSLFFDSLQRLLADSTLSKFELTVQAIRWAILLEGGKSCVVEEDVESPAAPPASSSLLSSSPSSSSSRVSMVTVTNGNDDDMKCGNEFFVLCPTRKSQISEEIPANQMQLLKMKVVALGAPGSGTGNADLYLVSATPVVHWKLKSESTNGMTVSGAAAAMWTVSLLAEPMKTIASVALSSSSGAAAVGTEDEKATGAVNTLRLEVRKHLLSKFCREDSSKSETGGAAAAREEKAEEEKPARAPERSEATDEGGRPSFRHMTECEPVMATASIAPYVQPLAVPSVPQAPRYGESDLLPGGGPGGLQPGGGMHMGLDHAIFNHPQPNLPRARFDPIGPEVRPATGVPYTPPDGWSGVAPGNSNYGRAPLFPGEPDPDHLLPLSGNGIVGPDACGGPYGRDCFRIPQQPPFGPPGGRGGAGGRGGMNFGGPAGFGGPGFGGGGAGNGGFYTF